MSLRLRFPEIPLAALGVADRQGLSRDFAPVRRGFSLYAET
jgi:hypothetical protein